MEKLKCRNLLRDKEEDALPSRMDILVQIAEKITQNAGLLILEPGSEPLHEN
jgi:hypothetical protein